MTGILTKPDGLRPTSPARLRNASLKPCCGGHLAAKDIPHHRGGERKYICRDSPPACCSDAVPGQRKLHTRSFQNLYQLLLALQIQRLQRSLVTAEPIAPGPAVVASGAVCLIPSSPAHGRDP